MGIYLNPGNEVFRRVSSADIFVDKSGMLRVTNDMIDADNNLVCMSRARRFGKTVAQNMIAAYYSKGCDSRTLFDSLEISGDPDYEKYLNKYNVIQIDLNSEYQGIENKENIIKVLTEDIKNEMRTQFPDIVLESEDSLARSILKVFMATGETFVLLIDEYDVLVREKVSQKLFDDYLSFLNGLFKSNTLRPAISLAYLTGILPVVRDKIQSKLNNFDEYTMMDADGFAGFIGFTSDEVKALCDRYGMDFEECRGWYDGYSINGVELYNPESVVKSMKKEEYGGYWSKTSSYQVITDRIKQNFKGIKDDIIRMLAGEEIDVNVTSYLNTMDSFFTKDDVFTYLIHLGYLAYDRKNGTCRIPNREVRQEWFNAIAVNREYEATDEIIKNSKELLEATFRGDEEEVARALDESHMHVASNRNYHNENVFQSAIYLAYIYALNKYVVKKEVTSRKGFADVVYLPYVKGVPAMVIELKHNKTVESALDQIKDKQYFESLDRFSGEVLLVGINYDEKTKVHSCRIERWKK
ncbi:MAG: AAA family ATPase [Eubacterium sp.]|nr:AAA family ATPase [Eubacterium sp.]